MNSNREKQLEAEIARALRQLPELPAPDDLIPNVMARLATRTARAWYRSPWTAWPLALRTASLLVLAALFAGICLASGALAQTEGANLAAEQVAAWFSGIQVMLGTVAVVLNAFVWVGKGLGPVFIAACILIWACSYAACLGIGTMAFRFAFARR